SKAEASIVVSTNSTAEFKRKATVPTETRRYRGHVRLRHSSRMSASMTAAQIKGPCSLKELDARTMLWIVGASNPASLQICCSFGNINMWANVQNNNAGNMKMPPFK